MNLAALLAAGAGGTLIEATIKSIALGSIYALMGLGTVIIFKGTQVLNFATGAIAMAGAIFMSIIVTDGGLPLPFISNWNPLAPDPGVTPGVWQWIANLLLALCFAAGFGLILERLAIRPMVGQPLFAMAVITLGLEVAIRPFNNDAVALGARSLSIPWGNDTFSFPAGAVIPKSFIAAIICGIIAFAIVFYFYRSRYGIAMRAVAFDQEAAMAQGINVGQVFAIAWAFGSALAALGAIFFGMSGWPPNGAVSGEYHPLLAFRVLPVIVLGGLDSVKGAVYGGLLIAFGEIFAGVYLSSYSEWLGAGYSSMVPYIVMIAVLFIRPFGLFGTEEIRRV